MCFSRIIVVLKSENIYIYIERERERESIYYSSVIQYKQTLNVMHEFIMSESNKQCTANFL